MMDAAERALLAGTVHDAVARAAATGRNVDATLAELEWLDILGAEPDAAYDIVFGVLGTTNATATVLDDVVVSGLGVQPRPERAALLPPFGAWHVPGRIDRDRVHARGMVSARIATAGEVVLVCDDGDELWAVTMPAGSVDTTAMRGVDPDADLRVATIDTHAGSVRALPDGAWDVTIANARRAVAHQIAGAARAMLELARTHALERNQFGRPIARFQAVRHRLADALVAIEALDATLAAAADEPGPQTAALAKAVAGQAVHTVATHCQQVLAGIGFTTEHPFHRYLKRTMLLDGWFGAADDITAAIGHELLRSQSVPTLIEL
jgi:hypothetical protein